MIHYSLQVISVLLIFLQLNCNSPIGVNDVNSLKKETDISNNDPEEDHRELTTVNSSDLSLLKTWNWSEIDIPPYSWADGVAFGDGLYIDIAYDPQGVTKVGQQLRFIVDPLATPPDAPDEFNFRSEIHTDPWPINHPLKTEQWMGWEYTFGENYVIDPTSPITIFQNHPGITGLSPQIELELAGLNTPSPAQGGEIQVVNEASSHRIVYPVKPEAGDRLEVVIHVIYGLGTDGLLQIWLNGTLFYNEKTSTVYEDYPWGGNNKWGVYHHTFNNSPDDVQSSLNVGAGKVELFMSNLRLLTRTPDHAEYGTNAYDLVRPIE